MNLTDFIAENMFVLMPVLYFVGLLLKNTPKCPDWLIPYLILIVAILLAFGIGGVSIDSLIQGFLVAGATVLTNQLIKQTVNK